MTDEFAFQSLSGLVQLDLLEIPLDVALARLSRIAGVPIWIDARELAGAGIPLHWPVTLTAEGLTLAGALDRLLPEELTYFVQGGELVITSKDGAEMQPHTRVYHVGANAAELADDIADRGAIEGLPGDYWSNYGGPGEITALADEWLLITAEISRHGQIEDWLTERRTCKPPLRKLERRALDETRTAVKSARDAELQQELGSPERDPLTVPATEVPATP